MDVNLKTLQEKGEQSNGSNYEEWNAGRTEFLRKRKGPLFRHTASHILAQAVKRLYPDAKLAIGPAIDDGFYYDFDFSSPISSDDFAAIEKEMKKDCKGTPRWSGLLFPGKKRLP